MVMQIVTILPTSKNGRGNSNRKEGRNRETHLIEPKDILIAKGLRTKRAAQKYIEFYKEEYNQKENMYEILMSEKKEAENETDA